MLKHQPFGEDRGGFGQGQGRGGQKRPQWRTKGLVHGMAQFVRQRQNFAAVAAKVEHDIRVVA